MPSIEELQSAVTQSLEAAVDSMRFASELMAKNTAQQQEIERLRGENAELLQENVRLLTPTHDEFRQLLAAQRKGERAVDVEALADELAACEWPKDNWPVSHAALASNMKPILRRHLEPQGDNCQPTINLAETDSSAQAVAPASPVRDAGYSVCILESELAALRKQVEDGERDTKRLERLLSGNCWSVQRQWGDCGWQVYDPIQARVVGSGRTAKEALDDAATPEPKEPA
jgi:hypothetical protein